MGWLKCSTRANGDKRVKVCDMEGCEAVGLGQRSSPESGLNLSPTWWLGGSQGACPAAGG